MKKADRLPLLRMMWAVAGLLLLFPLLLLAGIADGIAEGLRDYRDTCRGVIRNVLDHHERQIADEG